MEEDKLNELLDHVNLLFLRYGIKSLTMDDISRHLHISKKTLYQFVSDKNDLVTRAMFRARELDECMINGISMKGLNAIDEMFEVSKHVTEELKDIHPSIFYDLEKYHPDAWNSFQEFKYSFVFGRLKSNVERGIQEGLYRPDLKPDLAAKMWVSRIDSILSSRKDLYAGYSFTELYLETLRHHIRGLATDEGIAYLKKKIQQQKDK
jgi:AcrR family transcriptional regulator